MEFIIALDGNVKNRKKCDIRNNNQNEEILALNKTKVSAELYHIRMMAKKL